MEKMEKKIQEVFQKFCEKQKGHLEKLLWGN